MADFFLIFQTSVIQYHTDKILKLFLKTPVTYDKITFSPLSSQVEFHNLKVWARPRIQNELVLRADKLTLSLDLLRQGVRQITLTRGKIYLERRENQWNFQDILAPQKKTSAPLPKILLRQVEVSLSGISNFDIYVVRGQITPPSSSSPLEIMALLKDKNRDFERVFLRLRGREKIRCAIHIHKLSLGSSLQKKLPQVVQKTLSHFTPSGKIDLNLHLTLDSKNFSITKMKGHLRSYNLGFQIKKLPHPISHITGIIEFAGTNLHLKNLWGDYQGAPIKVWGRLFDFGKKGGEIYVRVRNILGRKKFLALIPEKEKEIRKIIWLFHPRGKADFLLKILADPPYDTGINLSIQVRNVQASFQDFPYLLENIGGHLRIRTDHLLNFTSRRYRFSIPQGGGRMGLPMVELARYAFPRGVLVSFFLKGYKKSARVTISGNVMAPVQSKAEKKRGDPKPDPGIDLTFQARNLEIDNNILDCFSKLKPFQWAMKTLSPRGVLDGWVRIQMPPLLADVVGDKKKGDSYHAVFPQIRLFPKNVSMVFSEIPLPLDHIQGGEVYIDMEKVQLKNLQGRYKKTEIKINGQFEIPYLVDIPLLYVAQLDRGILPELARKRLKIRSVYLSPQAVVQVQKRGKLWLIRDGDRKIRVQRNEKALDFLRFPQRKDWIRLSIKEIPITKEVLRALEKSQPALVKKLRSFRASGAVSLEIYLEPKGLFQPSRMRVKVKLHDVKATFEKYTLSHLNGTFRLIQNQITFDVIAGRWKGATVFVTGKINNLLSSHPQFQLDVTLSQLVLGDWVKTFLPTKIKPLWKKISPKGYLQKIHLQLKSRISKEGKDEIFPQSIEVEVGRLSSRLAPLPLLVCNGGNLRFRRGDWKVTRLDGQCGRGRWKGEVFSRGKEFRGVVNLENFHISREDWKYLPKLLRLFGWKGEDFTKNMEFWGTVDLQISWHRTPDGKLVWQVKGYPKPLYSSFAVFPLPLTWNKGFFLYKSHTKILSLAHLKGRYSSSALSLYGNLHLGKKIELSLTLHLGKTQWTSSLISAFPKSLVGVFEKVKPRGYFSLSLCMKKNSLLPSLFFNGILHLYSTDLVLALPAKKWAGNVAFSGQIGEKTKKIEGMIRMAKGTYAGQPFRQLQSYFLFQNSTLSLPNISALLYSGKFKGKFSLSTIYPSPYQGEFAIVNGQLAEFSQANFSPPPKNPLKGNVKAHLKIYGNGEVSKSLKGQGWILVDHAQLFRLPYFLGAILNTISLKFLRFSRKPVFQKAWAKFSIDNNILHFDPKNIVIEGDTLSIVGRGKMDFKKNLNLRFTWVMGPSIAGVDQIIELFKEGFFFYFEVKGPSKKPRIRVRALKILTSPLGK